MSVSYTIKRLYDVAFAILYQKRLDRHDRWSREKLDKHQRSRLSSLVSYAVRHSPFYKKHYGHFVDGKEVVLRDLPVVNKAVMMENFDAFVTDPRLKLAELQSHIASLDRDDAYHLGEYRVLTTSGSSGRKGVFVFNRKEWSTAIAGYWRCGAFMGIKPRLPRWKMAIVAAGSPMHVSYRSSVSSDVGIMKVKRLEATACLQDLVRDLNEFQPECLAGYPSVISLLADDQIEGRLQIRPRVISTTGELRTEDMEQKMRKAWGTVPYNLYGMTESGVFCGSDCSLHRGIHIFEDLFIVEAVDERNRPVHDGALSTKLLITNLFNYTQPLIRYEVSDMVSMTGDACPCGRPFRRIVSMEGRSDDILYFPGSAGCDIAVHPLNFRSPMASFPDILEYRIVQERDCVDVSLVLRQGTPADQVAERVKKKLREKVETLGARCPELRIRQVPCIERDTQKMGKLKIVQSNIKKAGK
ncbi:MAG TPA: hypothetical protein VFK23_08805 [Nitrospirota bacterium]|nr:hypothetical protein [Nitrospirota bacterium]